MRTYIETRNLRLPRLPVRLWTCLARPQRKRLRTILCDHCKRALAVTFAIRLTPDDAAGKFCAQCGARPGDET